MTEIKYLDPALYRRTPWKNGGGVSIEIANLTGAMYLTLSVDADVAVANARLDSYLEQYYSFPAAGLRKRQECFAGPPSAVAEYLAGYARAGATHLVLRFAGDHERHLETVAKARSAIE